MVKLTYYSDDKCEDKNNEYTDNYGGRRGQPDCCMGECNGYDEDIFCLDGVPTVAAYKYQYSSGSSDCDGTYYSSPIPWGENCITIVRNTP